MSDDAVNKALVRFANNGVLAFLYLLASYWDLADTLYPRLLKNLIMESFWKTAVCAGCRGRALGGRCV